MGASDRWFKSGCVGPLDYLGNCCRQGTLQKTAIVPEIPFLNKGLRCPTATFDRVSAAGSGVEKASAAATGHAGRGGPGTTYGGLVYRHAVADRRTTDFSDVSSGKRLAPVHPGHVLLKDFIEPMGISRYRVAKNIDVPQRRIDLICRGEAGVSAEMALRLGRLFGMTPEFWINLRAQYDLEVAERAAGKEIARAVVPLAA
jgi:addiction module HigA family antidote